WFAMSAGVATLKTRAILATGTPLTGLASRSTTVKDAIAFDPQETTGRYVRHPSQKRSTGIPPIANDHRAQTALGQPGDDRLQLACCHFCGQSSRSHPCHIQDKGSLACFFGQQHDAA